MSIYLVIGREEYEADVTIKAFCEERDAEAFAEKIREIKSREPESPDEYFDDELWQADHDKWQHDMLDAGCPFIGSWEEVVTEPLEVVESQPAEQERTGQRPSEVLHAYLSHAGLEGLTSSGVNITDMIEYFEQREGAEQERTCPDCDGGGESSRFSMDDGEFEPCDTCEGKGRISSPIMEDAKLYRYIESVAVRQEDEEGNLFWVFRAPSPGFGGITFRQAVTERCGGKIVEVE